MITLYPSQVPPYRALIRSEGHFALGLPTGMGKTVIGVAATANLIARGFRVLVAAPQEHIEDGFTKRSYTQIRVDANNVIEAGPGIIQAARENGHIVDTIREYLEDTETPTHALACTHAALCHFRPPTGVPADMSNCVLLVDEGHHGPALGFSQFIDAAEAAGCRIIYLSATLWRTDGEPVLRPNMQLFKVSLPRFMAEGGAPHTFRSGVHAIRLSETVEREAFHGERDPSPTYQLRIIQQMVARWEDDGRPKLIVRVPPMRGGSSDMVNRVIGAFRRAGARVLDVSGSAREDKARFHRGLLAERALRNYHNSQYDVVVGIQRVREGMDWKWCSTVYCVGLPKSTQFITQLMGRASRKKQPEWRYPAIHREVMQIEFFVPCGDAGTSQGLARYHSQSVLLICAFLDDYERNWEWRIIQELHRGITVPLSEALDDEDVPGTVGRALAYVDPQHHADVRVMLDQAHERLIAVDREPSIPNLYRWVVDHQPQVAHTVLKHVLCEIIVADENCSMPQAKQMLFAELNASLAEGKPLYLALLSAFDSVLDLLEDTCVVAASEIISPRLRSRILELTGQCMTDMAAQLAARRPLTPEWLLTVCQEHQVRTSNHPVATSRAQVEGWPRERWNNIDRAIRTGDRNWPLPNIPSLHAFCEMYVRDTSTEGGTMAQAVEMAAREVGLLETPIGRRLLENFLSRRVQANGDVDPMFLRDMPAFPPGPDYPRLDVALGAWLQQIREVSTGPIVEIHAWSMCTRIVRWLNQHRADGPYKVPGTATADRRDFTQQHQGTKLLFRVQTTEDRLRDLRPWLPNSGQASPVVSPDTTVCAILGRCPFSTGGGGDGAVGISKDHGDEMLGSRLLSTQTVEVQVPLVPVPGSPSRGRPHLCVATVEAIRDYIAAFETPRRTMSLRVPVSWFTSILVGEGAEAEPQAIDVLGALRAMPDVLDWAAHAD